MYDLCGPVWVYGNIYRFGQRHCSEAVSTDWAKGNALQRSLTGVDKLLILLYIVGQDLICNKETTGCPYSNTTVRSATRNLSSWSLETTSRLVPPATGRRLKSFFPLSATRARVSSQAQRVLPARHAAPQAAVPVATNHEYH